MLRALNICVFNGKTVEPSSYALILGFEVNPGHKQSFSGFGVK